MSEVEAGGWAGVRCTSRNGRDWVDGCGSVPMLGFRNVMPGPAGAFSASGAVHFIAPAGSVAPHIQPPSHCNCARRGREPPDRSVAHLPISGLAAGRQPGSGTHSTMEWLFGKKKTPAGALPSLEISPRACALPPSGWLLSSGCLVGERETPQTYPFGPLPRRAAAREQADAGPGDSGAGP